MTRREAEVLGWMAALPNEEMVYERGRAYFGLQRVAARVVFSMIRNYWVRQCHDTRIGKVEHYQISETGQAALAEHLGAR